jgi:hypothetical protein
MSIPSVITIAAVSFLLGALAMWILILLTDARRTNKIIDRHLRRISK